MSKAVVRNTRGDEFEIRTERRANGYAGYYRDNDPRSLWKRLYPTDKGGRDEWPSSEQALAALRGFCSR